MFHEQAGQKRQVIQIVADRGQALAALQQIDARLAAAVAASQIPTLIIVLCGWILPA